jgi:four helix bundle suffix protein
MKNPSAESENFIPPHGGYAGLLAYQKALIVFEGTVRFCERFLERRDRTIDQMVQAARSGKQNIVEGSKISGTSKEAEIKLINVARSSLEELLEDYRDFLRVRGLHLWPKDSREALFVRKLGAQKDVSYRTYQTHIESRPPEVVANILICLIHQTNYLLDQLLRKLEKDFVELGGLRERMTHARLAHRAKQNSST